MQPTNYMQKKIRQTQAKQPELVADIWQSIIVRIVAATEVNIPESGSSNCLLF